MKANQPENTRLLRRLAWSAAGLTVGLIVLGGVVRITGSGMGCGDSWPRCNGQWFPPLDLPTLIESSHRWVAAVVSILVLATTGVAWFRHRTAPLLTMPATLASALLIGQVLLGAITVKLSLPPWVVITHFANAMVLLAVLIVTALRAGLPAERRSPLSRMDGLRHDIHPMVLATGALGFGVILFGAQVANLDAGLLCLGFPLCNGSLLPPAAPLASIHWLHRVLAFGFLAAVLVLAVQLRDRTDPAGRRTRRWVHLVAATTLVQILLGATMVLHLLPAWLRAAHLLVGTLLWSGLVILLFHSGRTPALEPEGPSPAPGKPGRLADLVTLTKPRIISLLLVTTVAPMFITPAGMPSPTLVLWVLIGGYLMAGGANAINMWFDRDIDARMVRTRLRPIPAGRISPAGGLAFGIGSGVVAFAVFWFLVNPLAAWIALGGLLFYVFVYTAWLKRSSPQNIVIGGAAGAFPPLVGWAAVTGELDLAALYLFAIIFYWTPPHFWALALVKQEEYARAGVPMLPVVRGERRTKFEMLTYTLILLPLTLMPAFFGALGVFYAAAAALLGIRLTWYSVRLLRESSTVPLAWRMYRYSLLYLALLFVAMGIDRALPSGRVTPDKVLILDRPDRDIIIPTGALQGE